MDHNPSLSSNLKKSSKHIAIFTRMSGSGGVQRVMLELANQLANQGHHVDLLLTSEKGVYFPFISASVHVVVLKSRRSSILSRCLKKPSHSIPSSVPILYLFTNWKDRIRIWLQTLREKLLRHSPPQTSITLILRSVILARYLTQYHPDVLLSALTEKEALLAKQIASTNTRIVISIRCYDRSPSTRKGHHYQLLKALSPYIDRVVTVSKEVADNFAQIINLPPEQITTIYNGVDLQKVQSLATHPVEHPWIQDPRYTVILAVGRLAKQKDYPTLIKAFKLLNQQNARLIILGRGKMRKRLQRLVSILNLEDYIDFPGWVSNPFAFMSRVRLFVLSSNHEGLPNVLIEAMACGCAVVSTDCRSGPREILEEGKWGELVSVGDEKALAQAMERTLSVEPDRTALRKRANFFSIEKCTQLYEQVLVGHIPQP